MMKLSDIKKWPTERLSTTLLYAMIAVTIVVYGAFYMIGYTRPDTENPVFNAPLLTNVLLIFIVLMLLLAAAIIIWAVVRCRRHTTSMAVVNGIPARRLTVVVAFTTCMLLALTFLLSSSAVVTVNGQPFAVVFWLKAAGMFVTSSLVMILVAVAVVCYGYFKSAHRHVKAS